MSSGQESFEFLRIHLFHTNRFSQPGGVVNCLVVAVLGLFQLSSISNEGCFSLRIIRILVKVTGMHLENETIKRLEICRTEKVPYWDDSLFAQIGLKIYGEGFRPISSSTILPKNLKGGQAVFKETRGSPEGIFR